MGNTKTMGDAILKSFAATVFAGAFAIIIGCVFIFTQGDNKPIERAEAISYSGTFASYKTYKNYCGIHFEDGSKYEVYPHTETQEFHDTMKSLKEGTMLYLLINPNNHYVAEIKTDTEELLNFELSQKEIDSYDNGYIWIGIFACLSGVFLICYAVISKISAKKEKERRAKKKNPNAIRFADKNVKCKILLEATVVKYRVCYRRVKMTNELVVNGLVYDEKKAVIEFEHKLFANIDNHVIEAGLDEQSYSYIKFDNKLIKNKKRII